MEKTTKIIITIAIIIIIILLGYFIFKYTNTMEQGVTKQDIQGTWTAVSEEVKEQVNTEIDASITFNPDNTYISVSEGLEEQGFYKVKEGDIHLYESEEQTEEDYMSRVYAKVNKDTLALTITYPQYPKIVIYKKV